MILPILRSISMDGFKCFDTLSLKLDPLTMLTGFNGGGKSTALQPLLLISQAIRHNQTLRLPLNGPLVKLGTAGDISSLNSDRPIVFRAEWDNFSAEFRPILQAGERILNCDVSDELFKLDQVVNGLKSLSFLGAVRIGAEDAFPIPNNVDPAFDFPDVGADGRYAPFWYDRYVDDEVSETRRMPDVDAPTFRKQLDAWLGFLFPGAEANVQTSVALSKMNLQFRMSSLGSWSRPSNIGYGLTYAFPILVALLTAKKGQIIVIDSPEAHLHPFVQSQMGRLLAQFANADVQIIVETHSEHLLNGVRHAVHQKKLLPENVSIHFFKGPDDHDHGVVSPSINSTGDIYEWPDGFFDQAEKDLSQLIGWS